MGLELGLGLGLVACLTVSSEAATIVMKMEVEVEEDCTSTVTITPTSMPATGLLKTAEFWKTSAAWVFEKKERRGELKLWQTLALAPQPFAAI